MPRNEPAARQPPPGGPRAALLAAATAYVAEHGFGEASLRQIAAGIGTSHRMLIYHFGSKRGLSSAIIEAIQQAQLQALQQLRGDQTIAPADAAQRFWDLVTDNAMTFGPLFFELAANAMRGQHREPMAVLGVRMWLEPLAELWRRGGAAPDRAPLLARISLAVANGLLLDALLTGDREVAKVAMQAFAENVSDEMGRAT
jgi:AcrR family transcriptional regulator